MLFALPLAAQIATPTPHCSAFTVDGVEVAMLGGPACKIYEGWRNPDDGTSLVLDVDYQCAAPTAQHCLPAVGDFLIADDIANIDDCLGVVRP
jgi:hypothetical protein